MAWGTVSDAVSRHHKYSGSHSCSCVLWPRHKTPYPNVSHSGTAPPSVQGVVHCKTFAYRQSFSWIEFEFLAAPTEPSDRPSSFPPDVCILMRFEWQITMLWLWLEDFYEGNQIALNLRTVLQCRLRNKSRSLNDGFIDSAPFSEQLLKVLWSK